MTSPGQKLGKGVKACVTITEQNLQWDGYASVIIVTNVLGN